jgi:hypothetical protein
MITLTHFGGGKIRIRPEHVSAIVSRVVLEAAMAPQQPDSQTKSAVVMINGTHYHVRENVPEVQKMVEAAEVINVQGETLSMEPDPRAVKLMVDRFLGWHLPNDFSPDAGIKFKRVERAGLPMPTGTNLLTATQAEAMIRYLLEEPARELPNVVPFTGNHGTE